MRHAVTIEVNWDDPHLDFTQYSDTGVIGDATRASAELGWDAGFGMRSYRLQQRYSEMLLNSLSK